MLLLPLVLLPLLLLPLLLLLVSARGGVMLPRWGVEANYV